MQCRVLLAIATSESRRCAEAFTMRGCRCFTGGLYLVCSKGGSFLYAPMVAQHSQPGHRKPNSKAQQVHILQEHWMRIAPSGTMWCSSLYAVRTQTAAPATVTSATPPRGWPWQQMVRVSKTSGHMQLPADMLCFKD
jgi:hypothetical protein